jgi:hypothetical protein
MKREHVIRLVAGTLVLAGVALHHWVNPWWLLLTVFAGANLFQSSLTKWCLLEDILRKFDIGGGSEAACGPK